MQTIINKIKIIYTVLTNKSFLIALNATICLDVVRADTVMFVEVSDIQRLKCRSKFSISAPDIRTHPYIMPNETKAQYRARIEQGKEF